MFKIGEKNYFLDFHEPMLIIGTSKMQNPCQILKLKGKNWKSKFWKLKMPYNTTFYKKITKSDIWFGIYGDLTVPMISRPDDQYFGTECLASLD